MPTTSADIVNQALQMIGDNQPMVQGTSPTFDNSPGGVAAQKLYVATVQEVGRLFEWDFARKNIALSLSGNVAPVGWTYEYRYPTNGIEVWQLMPASLSDPNNPLPINWVVANNIVGGEQVRVIHTDLVSARAVYNNDPRPEAWDATFTESVVRLLASKFAMALAGRPETAQNLLDSFNNFVNAAKSRDG